MWRAQHWIPHAPRPLALPPGIPSTFRQLLGQIACRFHTLFALVRRAHSRILIASTGFCWVTLPWEVVWRSCTWPDAREGASGGLSLFLRDFHHGENFLRENPGGTNGLAHRGSSLGEGCGAGAVRSGTRSPLPSSSSAGGICLHGYFYLTSAGVVTKI